MKNTIIWCLLIMLIIPTWSVAQTNLKVKVIDKESGELIPYVILKTNKQVQSTDRNGACQLLNLELEDKIKVERIGYVSQTFNLNEQLVRDNSLKIELEKKPFVFGEIVIEDTRTHSIPQSDELIDEIKMMSQPMDAGDLLRGVNGFGVLKRGAYAQEPVFRSFKQEQINILFDGFIQYNHACPNRMDPAITHVIPAEINKVEIVKGPFSVRYGPAMGATLNYLTESAYEGKMGFSGTVESGYEFNGKGKTGRAALAYKANKFDVYANASIKDYEDYSSGSDTIVPSSFNSKDYGIKIGFNPSSNQRLMLTWKQSFLRDAKYAGLAMDASKDDSSLGAISYKIKNLSPSILSFELKAYGDIVDHVMDNFDRKNFAAVEAVSTVKADTYGAKMELNIVPARKNLLFAGLDYKLLKRDGIRERLVKKNMQTGADLPTPKSFTDKIWQDSEMSNIGVFLENKFYHSSKMTITAGVRGDMVAASINDPEEDFASMYDLEDKMEFNFSANLSAAYYLSNGLSTQIAFGRGVRSATIDERYINHFAVGKDPYELVGNPNLKPEVNNQVEWSLRKQSKLFDIQMNVFYSYLNNLITAALDTTLGRKYSPWLEPKFAKRYDNVENAFQTGMELSIDYSITKHLNIHGQWAYTYAQNLSWDEPISRVPPMEGGVALSYERSKWWTSLNGRFVGPQNRVAESFGEVKTEGFNLFDFRIGVKPVKGMVLGLTVNNILDTDYVEFLNWSFNKLIGDGLVLEPGRNTSLYLRYSF